MVGFAGCLQMNQLQDEAMWANFCEVFGMLGKTD